MSIKPILFSTPMVQALLNTKPNTWPPEPIDESKPCKGMTRRVVKPQPKPLATSENLIIENGKLKKTWRGEMMIWQTEIIGKPKYKVGDVLWVRETFKPRFKDAYLYKAHLGDINRAIFDNTPLKPKWKPSIFMPRKAARIFLKVRGVRIEELLCISRKDLKYEGMMPDTDYADIECQEAAMIVPFRDLWNSINAKRGFGLDGNPYVWVYEFERVEV